MRVCIWWNQGGVCSLSCGCTQCATPRSRLGRAQKHAAHSTAPRPGPQTGTLPAAWSNLTSLQELRLGGNRLNGSIPWTGAAKFTVPPRVIDLSGGNLLTGNIPPEFAGAEEVLLAGNALTGQIPVALAASPALRRLVLPGNKLTGALPPVVAATNLTELDVSANLLSGALPDVPGSVVRLQLDGNPGLTGTLPAQV